MADPAKLAEIGAVTERYRASVEQILRETREAFRACESEAQFARVEEEAHRKLEAAQEAADRELDALSLELLRRH